MPKFFLSCDIRFLIGMGMSNVTPTSGKHMKMSEVNAFLKNHQDYSYVRVRNSRRGNDYVISTPMKFLGENYKTVKTMSKAKSFPSAEEAYKYLDSNKDKISSDIYIVIDEKYCRKKRTSPKIEPDIKPDEIISFAKMDTSERVKLPANVKEEVYKKSGGVCEICGKPLSKLNYTVDHIIPLSRGGTNEMSNLRAVHKTCNQIKGNFLDGEMNNASAFVSCNNLYKEPLSNFTAMLARSFMRGIVNKYEAQNAIIKS